MLECVPNVSEGRDARVLDMLAAACGTSLLDVHADPDHHRSVFTLAGPGPHDAAAAVRHLARATAEHLGLGDHDGVHPRIGVLDVVPFVALDPTPADDAIDAARAFATWITDELAIPALRYGDADPQHRSLPQRRRDAARVAGHPRLGIVAVGARPVLVAVNCELDRDDVQLAGSIASQIRERDGGLPGVRALGFRLSSRAVAQISMNLTDLSATGLQQACETVRSLASTCGADVTRVELVGLVPASELARCDAPFLEWAGVDAGDTIEARLARSR